MGPPVHFTRVPLVKLVIRIFFFGGLLCFFFFLTQALNVDQVQAQVKTVVVSHTKLAPGDLFRAS